MDKDVGVGVWGVFVCALWVGCVGVGRGVCVGSVCVLSC